MLSFTLGAGFGWCLSMGYESNFIKKIETCIQSEQKTIIEKEKKIISNLFKIIQYSTYAGFGVAGIAYMLSNDE